MSMRGSLPVGFLEAGRLLPDRTRASARASLPQVRQVLERAVKEWKPQSPAPQRPAAYLLARWGTGDLQARGQQVLVQLAEADEPFYFALESIRLLHALKAPVMGGHPIHLRHECRRTTTSGDSTRWEWRPLCIIWATPAMQIWLTTTARQQVICTRWIPRGSSHRQATYRTSRGFCRCWTTAQTGTVGRWPGSA